MNHIEEKVKSFYYSIELLEKQVNSLQEEINKLKIAKEEMIRGNKEFSEQLLIENEKKHLIIKEKQDSIIKHIEDLIAYQKNYEMILGVSISKFSKVMQNKFSILMALIILSLIISIVAIIV